MTIQKAYRFELTPNGEQARLMVRIAGCCRYIWNRALALQEESHAAGGRFIIFETMCGIMFGWKQEKEWLNAAPSQVLQQTLKDLAKAYKMFFEHVADHPVFKKKGKCKVSFRYPQGFKVEQGNSRVFLPKLGWMRYRNSRKIEGTMKSVTVSCEHDRWFISVLTEQVVEEPIHPSESIVGCDRGIKIFAAMSDGETIAPCNAHKKKLKQLAKVQQALSRTRKGSKNRKKRIKTVSKCHGSVANTRKDFLHKLTSDQSKNYAAIIIEDLQIENMSRSAAGSVEEPGKNVAQKSGLNRAILDQGWGEYARQLDYKLAWKGGLLAKVPAPGTSITCRKCDLRSPENRKTQELFSCIGCGHEENADIHAAKFIEGVGRSSIPVLEWAARAAHNRRKPQKSLCSGSAHSV